MNSSIEIQDSAVGEIRTSAEGVTIRLAPAYVHKSNGRPGVDAGSGWTQEAQLFISDATLVGRVPILPCLLAGGTLVVGGGSHENMIPLPLDTEDPTTIKLWFGYLDLGIEVQKKGSRMQLLGEATRVEDFIP